MNVSRYQTDLVYREVVKARTKKWRQKNAAHVRAKAKIASTKWRAAHPEKYAALQLSRYGITPAEKATMVKAQGNRCACCSWEKALVVDHDHVTGKVRGLLCHRCNVGLGLLGDSVEGIAQALRYLTD